MLPEFYTVKALLSVSRRSTCRLEKNHATKEIHYFDRWPHVNGSEETYMSLFPDATVRAAHDNATRQLEAAGISPETLTTAAGIRTAYRELSHEVAFFDASPNYFPVAHVAPRMHAVMPHARIVVVLRVRRGLLGPCMFFIAGHLPNVYICCMHVSQKVPFPAVWPRCLGVENAVMGDTPHRAGRACKCSHAVPSVVHSTIWHPVIVALHGTPY